MMQLQDQIFQSSSREQAKKVGEPSPGAVPATFLPIFRPQ
jgi:hypothetical protein